jgi:light-regulated signal transduction histidine kinase (bacteriophytochrome)
MQEQTAAQLADRQSKLTATDSNGSISNSFRDTIPGVLVTTLSTLGDIIVGLVSDLTGFHRVMFYQFDETGAGGVPISFHLFHGKKMAPKRVTG